MKTFWKQTLVPSFSLFTASGTLICCALPALMVSIGAGTVLAGLVSSAPWLVAVSEYKSWVFVIAGVLLVIAGMLQYRARHAPCPADPTLAKACARMRTISWWIYWASVVIYLIGFFFAFIAVHLF